MILKCKSKSKSKKWIRSYSLTSLFNLKGILPISCSRVLQRRDVNEKEKKKVITKGNEKDPVTKENSIIRKEEKKQWRKQ